MHAVGTCVLIVGFAILLIAGLLRLVRDLFSRSVFAAPLPPNEDHVPEIAEEATPSSQPNIEAPNRSQHRLRAG
jgi:hypothetical protein